MPSSYAQTIDVSPQLISVSVSAPLDCYRCVAFSDTQDGAGCSSFSKFDMIQLTLSVLTDRVQRRLHM
jgi:hypothetical protein